MAVTLSSDEQNAQRAQSLIALAETALNTNLAYLAIGSPTQAQAIAQVGVLTKQVDGIIRILMNQLSSLAGT